MTKINKTIKQIASFRLQTCTGYEGLAHILQELIPDLLDYVEKLEEEQKQLQKEVTTLAQESVKREIQLAKLEKEVLETIEPTENKAPDQYQHAIDIYHWLGTQVKGDIEYQAFPNIEVVAYHFTFSYTSKYTLTYGAKELHDGMKHRIVEKLKVLILQDFLKEG